MAKSQYDQPLFYRIGKVLFYILLVFAILILALVSVHSVYTNNKGVPPKLFGYTVMVSNSDSLKATVNQGSALIIKETPISELKQGDIVTVKSAYSKIGLPVLDTQIVEEFVEIDGKTAIKTKTNGGVVDSPRYESDVIGKVVFDDMTWGEIITFIKSPMGIVVCVAIPLALLLVVQIINYIIISATGSKKKNANTGRPVWDVDPSYLYSSTAANDRLKSGSVYNTYTVDKSKVHQQMEHEKAPDIKADEDEPKRSANVSAPAAPKKEEPLPPLTFNIKAEAENIPLETVSRPIESHVPSKPPVQNINADNVVTEKPIVPPINVNVNYVEPQPKEEPAASAFEKPAEKPEEPIIEKAMPAEEVKEPVFEKPSGISSSPVKIAEPATKPVSAEESVPAKPRADEIAVTGTLGNPEFSANVKTAGKDRFSIEGIDVKVKPDALRLTLEDGRDLSITVTKDYTHVAIDNDNCRMNFALFKDDVDSEQKVIIQRKMK